MDDAIARHYESGYERERLLAGGDRLELVLRAARLAELVPAMSAHMLAIARR